MDRGDIRENDMRENDMRPDCESGLGHGDRMELRIWLRLLACTNLLDHELRQRLARVAGTTLPRFDVLAQLDRHGAPISMGELSQRLMVSKGNVTGLIDRLARDGLVVRSRSPEDRRFQMVEMTAAGRAFFARIADEHCQWVTDMMDRLPPGEMTALYTLLAGLKNSVLASIGKQTPEKAE